MADESGWSDETFLDLVTDFLSARARINPEVAEGLVSHLESIRDQEMAYEDEDEGSDEDQDIAYQDQNTDEDE